jgi:hypothetical protein
MKTPSKYTLLVTALAAGACSISMNGGGGGGTGTGENGRSCSIAEDEESATVTCDDGISTTIPLMGPGPEGASGSDGRTTLIETSIEAPGSFCPTGGVRIDTGVDADGNGFLDRGEIAETRTLCNGESGDSAAATLSALSPEPAGSHCPSGGVRVDMGPDTNGNGQLDAHEVHSTAYVCHGEHGAGPAMLTKLGVELPGETCEAGGVRIETGLDLDGDGVLDPSEVTRREEICHGLDGTAGIAGADGVDGIDGAHGTDGISTLTRITGEPEGENCAAGGIRVDSGSDDNQNGMLDPEEVFDTEYVCNGSAATSDGTAPLAATFTTPNPNVGTYVAAPNTATVLEASITVPGSGSLMIVGSADAYCAYPALGLGYDCSPTVATTGYLSVSQDPSAPAASGNYSFFSLAANRTLSVSRSATFTVPEAGTYSFYLRGSAQTGQIGYWRGSLTLLFVPHAI